MPPPPGSRRRRRAAHLASLALDRGAGSAPLHRQLYFAIRGAILDGRLRPGARLPGSRALAADLGVSRNTAATAMAQLAAEGFLRPRPGAGSTVATPPGEGGPVGARPPVPGSAGARAAPPPGPSRRGLDLAALVGPPRPPGAAGRAFAPGLPELAAFPFETWARLLARPWRRPAAGLLLGGDPLGFPPLREAVAAYLGAARAVRCTPGRVLIVSGAQQALDLAARALVDPGDRAWVEEPGYAGLRGALVAAGVAPVPVPVDAEGLSVAAGLRLAPDARLACVSPSHQYPLGVTMSLGRRLELLEWARAAGAFVLEDDYDSEYRYKGRPLAALQGLDDEGDGRVIYVGTLSKVMFPTLRLGYAVVPERLVDAFAAVRRASDAQPAMPAQPALAEFIGDGHLGQHIRRMRQLYARRQAALLEALAAEAPGLVAAAPAEAGMHLVGWLPEGADDRAAAAAARARGVEAPALSACHAAGGPAPRPGLLLGYAGVAEAAMPRAVRHLAAALREAGVRAPA